MSAKARKNLDDHKEYFRLVKDTWTTIHCLPYRSQIVILDSKDRVLLTMSPLDQDSVDIIFSSLFEAFEESARERLQTKEPQDSRLDSSTLN